MKLSSSVFAVMALCVPIIFSACNNPDAPEPVVIQKLETDTIEDEELLIGDTTLLKLNVESWNKSELSLRKANCASMVYKIADTAKFATNAEINTISLELSQCLDDATYGMPTMNNDAILPIIKSCLNSMGIREESTSKEP